MKFSPDENIGPAALAQRYDLKGKLLVHSIFATWQGEMPFGGRSAVFLRLGGCNRGGKSFGCLFCFPSSTNITTPSGTKNLSDLNVGDNLFTFDDKMALTTTKIKKVLKRFVPREDFLEIAYKMPNIQGIKKLIVTKEHPFNIVKKGFIPAEKLKVGDEIYHVDTKSLVSYRMKDNNPMKDPKVSKKVGDIVKSKYESGEIKPYKRTKSWRKNQAQNMRENNPMWQVEAKLGMMLNKTYEKSGLEKRFQRWMKELGIQVKYVGNKDFIIGEGTELRRPDFLIGKNKVIETYDPTFKLYAEGIRTKENYEKPTTEFYKKYGYKVLFITPKDFDHPGSGNGHLVDNSKLEAKVNKFIHNGAKIVSISPLTNKSFTYLKKKNKVKDDKIEITNFSCSPHNTFLINGVHVHNCDTAFEVKDSKLMTIKEVAQAINALRSEATELLVVTGGEPLMQQDALMKLFELHEYLPNHIQIETNGDFDFKPEHKKAVDWLPFTVVCSPKAWDGVDKPFKSLALKPENINFYRFLISATQPEYMQVPEEILENCKDGIGKTGPRTLYLSPMTVYYEDSTKEERNKGWGGTSINVAATVANYQHSIKVADVLLKNGYWVRLSSQSHLMYGIA
jgi:organic radical activating enzyme